MTDRLDPPPRRATAHLYHNRYGQPCCSACKRVVGRHDQWRCCWLDCRTWLFGTDNPPKSSKKKREEQEAALS